ncbi:MAG: hypothetical protein QM776_04535 [Rhodocyclaceae bacterium]
MSSDQLIAVFVSAAIAFFIAGCLAPLLLLKFRPQWQKTIFGVMAGLTAGLVVIVFSSATAYTHFSLLLTISAGACVAGFLLGLLLTPGYRRIKLPIVCALAAGIVWQWQVVLMVPVFGLLPAVLPALNEQLPSGLVCRVEESGLGFAARHTASLIQPIGLGFGVELHRHEISCDDSCGQANVDECQGDGEPRP